MVLTKNLSQMSDGEFRVQFGTRDGCLDYLCRRRWPNGVRCPRCGAGHVRRLGREQFQWECRSCNRAGYRFSVLTGTPLRFVKTTLPAWFELLRLAAKGKIDINVAQTARTLGRRNRSCLPIWRRIHQYARDPEFCRLVGLDAPTPAAARPDRREAANGG
jgi:transposase-like protein